MIGANLASHAMGSGSEVARKESTQQTGSAGSMGGTMARDQMEGNGRGACRGSGQGSSETEVNNSTGGGDMYWSVVERLISLRVRLQLDSLTFSSFSACGPSWCQTLKRLGRA